MIGKDGYVQWVHVLSQPPASNDLALAALDSVSTWSYRPARRDGEPVRLVMQADIGFGPR